MIMAAEKNTETLHCDFLKDYGSDELRVITSEDKVLAVALCTKVRWEGAMPC